MALNSKMVAAWDDAYAENTTNWEKLELDDLKRFIEDSKLNLGKVQTILEIGCGRGVRSLVMISTIPGLNRADCLSWA